MVHTSVQSTANCIHQYSYCILHSSDNYDYLLPVAFISTFTATTFISTFTACCIHQYTCTPFGSSEELVKVSEPPPSGADSPVSLCPAHRLLESMMPTFSGFRCDLCHISLNSGETQFFEPKAAKSMSQGLRKSPGRTKKLTSGAKAPLNSGHLWHG